MESDILILMPAPKLTNEIIIAAIAGFESQKTRIDAQIAELGRCYQLAALSRLA